MEDDATRPQPGGSELLGELRKLQKQALSAEGPVYDALMQRISALRAQIDAVAADEADAHLRQEIERLKEKLEAAKDPDVHAAIASAIREREAKLAQRAEESAEEADLPVSAEPLSPQQRSEIEALIQKAQVAKMRRQTTEATGALKEALEVAPQSPQVLELVGDDYVERRQYKAARSAYRRAVKLDPTNVGLERKLADVALKLEEADLLLFGQSLAANESAASGKASVVLSVILPGLGQLASGRTWTGAAMLGGFLVFAVVTWIMLGGSASQSGQGRSSYAFLLPMAAAAGFWLWSIGDASGRSKQFGRRSIDRPRPPVDLPFD